MVIRFGYRPPNPGPWSTKYKHVSSYIDKKDAIENYDGYLDIWYKPSIGAKYRKITYEQLLEL